VFVAFINLLSCWSCLSCFFVGCGGACCFYQSSFVFLLLPIIFRVVALTNHLSPPAAILRYQLQFGDMDIISDDDDDFI
jgi:hypothetical protein